MYRIGVDVGGTFTDFTVFGEAESKVWFFKVPSTPHDPSEAIQTGIRQIIYTLKLEQLVAQVGNHKRNGVKSVAICFMHSYLNASHEEAAKAAVQRLMPDAFISVSSEVLPEFREYERMSTTVLNAYVGPRMQN